MEPFIARYPDMPYGYLIEIEYIPRGKFNDSALKRKIEEAKAQLERYANDARIKEMATRVSIRKLILVYNGWELVHKEEWVG